MPGSEIALLLPVRDAEGFLCNSGDWSRAVALDLAALEGIELSEAHWEVLTLLRRYYQSYDSAPAMRAFVKYCRGELGPEKGTSFYLLTLFPGSPAKVAARLAGLPRPAHCL